MSVTLLLLLVVGVSFPIGFIGNYLLIRWVIHDTRRRERERCAQRTYAAYQHVLEITNDLIVRTGPYWDWSTYREHTQEGIPNHEQLDRSQGEDNRG